MRSKIAALLAVLVLVGTVHADYPNGRVSATLVKNYDPTTAGYTYVVYGDRNAVAAPLNGEGVSGVFGPGTEVRKKIITVGSSTSWTTQTASAAPFQGFAVGDLLMIPSYRSLTSPDEISEQERSITTFTDANNVVVNTALDLSAGYTFRFKKRITGTGANDAAFDVEGFDRFVVQIDLTTINATNITAVLECRANKYGTFVAYQAASVLTAVGSVSIPVNNLTGQCRVGFLITGDVGVNNVNAYLLAAK